MAVRNDAITLDVRKVGTSAGTLRWTEHDKGATLSIALSDGSLPLDMSGLMAELRAQAPCGYVREVLPTSGSGCTYTLGDDLTGTAGRGFAYVALISGDVVVCSTQRFDFECVAAADLTGPEAERAQRDFDRMSAEWEAQTSAQAEAFADAQAERDAAFAESQSARDADFDASQDRRDAEQDRNNADQAINNETARKLAPVVLRPGEYDPDTLVPTVAGEPNRLYFVPLVGVDGDAPDGQNLFVEWMLIGGKWERMGRASMEPRPMSTNEIDQVVGGGSPMGESVLSLTGLSYMWKRLRDWADSLYAPKAQAYSAERAWLDAHPVGCYVVATSGFDPADMGGEWELHELLGARAWLRIG